MSRTSLTAETEDVRKRRVKDDGFRRNSLSSYPGVFPAQPKCQKKAKKAKSESKGKMDPLAQNAPFYATLIDLWAMPDGSGDHQYILMLQDQIARSRWSVSHSFDSLRMLYSSVNITVSHDSRCRVCRSFDARKEKYSFPRSRMFSHKNNSGLAEKRAEEMKPYLSDLLSTFAQTYQPGCSTCDYINFELQAALLPRETRRGSMEDLKCNRAYKMIPGKEDLISFRRSRPALGSIVEENGGAVHPTAR